MNKKQLYEAPDAELLEIRYETAFLQGTNQGGTAGDDDEYDDQGDF